jgi:hypothetical protein
MTTNTHLNGKLYAKLQLFLALEGSVLQGIVSCKHLRANGLMLLQELVQTYKPKNVPELIAAKTSEFWGNTKRLPHETIDSYYNHFHELLDEPSDADEPIFTKSAIRHFIFTLGTEFESIQHNYHIGNLPSQWMTQDWPTLLVLCRDYLNLVNPKGILRKDLSADSTSDRITHQKKVKEWFLNPSKFHREIESEQRKHSGKCIYHLSKSHSTADCNVKKECDKLLAEKKDIISNSPSNGSGQLRHITEETFEDAVSDNITDGNTEDCSNDTNKADLLYFAQMTNHYLHLVKVSSSLCATSRHDMKYPIIADSGANYHMFKECEFFDSIRPANGQVFLSNGKTKLSVKGIGTVRCKIGDNVLCLDNV